MRLYLVIAVVAAQVLVLAVMAGQREWILATGETVYLRTAPIDPRDPFRGDFVRLSYALNEIDPGLLASAPEELPRGSVIHALLEPDARNVAAVRGYSLREPEERLYLRGRTRHHWRRHRGQRLWADFGIETYFVQQGRGLELEERQGRRDTMQIPLEMELAVGGDGTAIIRGHRWSPLGMWLEVSQPVEGEETPPAPRVTFSLLNASDAPLAIIDPPDHCALALESAGWGEQSDFVPAHDACDNVTIRAGDLRVLQPGEIHSVSLDLARPRWHVRTPAGEVLPVNALPNARLRLVYRVPERVDIDPENAFLWRGELPSPAFWAGGRVD